MTTRRQFIRLTAAATAATALRLSAAQASRASGYQLGCYTRPWDQFEYRVALDGIAEAGFKYAGLMTAKGKTWVLINPDSSPEEVSQIGEEARQRKLQIISIYGGDFPVAKSIDAGISGLRALIELCKLCSCPNLLLGGTTDEKLFTNYYKVVTECCDFAVSRGVGLSIKPHGGQNATGQQCRKIVQDVGRKNFGLRYDPGNIFYYSDGKLDPVEDSKNVNGAVVGMSVKDFKDPKEVLVTPGDGKVNFSKVLTNLRAGGFTSGPMVIECLSKSSDAAAITREARRAREFIEKLF